MDGVCTLLPRRVADFAAKIQEILLKMRRNVISRASQRGVITLTFTA
jgi:hypothetical protein